MDVTSDTPRRSRLMPWAALITALSGEAFHHQALSDMLRYDCRRATAAIFIWAAILVLAWMAAGAAISWTAVRSEPKASARRFVAIVGMLTGAMLALAVAWQTFAGLVVPGCPT